jgi:OmpA-OmpF porin, OOP family
MRIPAAFATLLLLGLPLLASADSTGGELFAPADQARELAETAEAALLAPDAYGKGISALQRARRDYEGGTRPEAVQKKLEEARQELSLAARSAAEARRAFAAELAKRESARDAEAFRLAGPAWVKAETQLTDAARRLEKSDVKGATKRAAEAGQLYEEAELEAIKAALLTEARALVVGLGPANTEKFAPKTTARARTLLERAEAELDADRHRRDAASRLAAQSAAEARHAVALAAYLRSAREADATPEDLVLEWESGLQRAAEAAGTTADLSHGPGRATDGVVSDIAALNARADQQAGDLEQRNRQIAALDDEIHELDARLEGVSNEARTLTERMEARERARRQLEQVEKAFPPDQAIVFRQGDDIIVRVQGLSFATGSAKLTEAASPMLEKLRIVVSAYPRALFAIEGHTDSTGDSAANQRLSQARADAVRDFLVDRLQVPAGRVTAIGYGDLRPIAKNDSSEGRRMNRRIDLVITPREQVGP